MSEVMGSIRRHTVFGTAAVFLLVGGVGGWAATTELAGAVVAPGTVVVEGNLRRLQHPTGGVVGALLVRDGDRVSAGDVLVRLDDTLTRANLAMVDKALVGLLARTARLRAERDGLGRLVIPPDLAARAAEPEPARAIAAEHRLLEARASARAGTRAQLAERIVQLEDEITGLGAQIEARDAEIALIGEELEGVRALFAKGLVQMPRVNALERDRARLVGDRGRLVAETAQVRGRIGEIRLQMLQIDEDLRSESDRELTEITARVNELVERRVAAEDALRRVEMRAPHDGIVHALSVHTVGGVIGPGESVLSIVPEDEPLVVEAQVPTREIDRLSPGQSARLHFSSFNQRTTPQIAGTVIHIAADRTVDPQTRAESFTVRIALSEDELARLGEDVRLVPGMPVAAFVKTDERTVISYLTKPLVDRLQTAFRER